MTTDNKQLSAFKSWLWNSEFDGIESAAKKDLTDYVAGLLMEMSDNVKDKTRIDWLADLNNEIGNVQLPNKCVENNIGSLRDAIDEAMEL